MPFRPPRLSLTWQPSIGTWPDGSCSKSLNTAQNWSEMKQIRVRKPKAPKPDEIDTRSPSGKPLPF